MQAGGVVEGNIIGHSKNGTTTQLIGYRSFSKLPRILNPFRNRHPRVPVEVTTSTTNQPIDIMEISNTKFIIRMIGKNRGISYLPLFMVREYAENGELTILDAADFRLAMYQQVIYHKNKWMTKKMDVSTRFLQFYYSEGVYENILEIMNGNSVTVRQVNMSDTPDRRIMGIAYEGEPVHTEFLLKKVQPTDGFTAFYDQMLVGLFKGRSFYIMGDSGKCIHSVDSVGTGKTTDGMASPTPPMNQGTGSLFKDGNYVVYERLEPYG